MVAVAAEIRLYTAMAFFFFGNFREHGKVPHRWPLVCPAPPLRVSQEGKNRLLTHALAFLGASGTAGAPYTTRAAKPDAD